MKKIVYLALSISLFTLACQPKETKTEQAQLPRQTGVTVDSSANISLVLKSFEAVNNMDSAAIRSCYIDTAKVNDNLTPMTIEKNISMTIGNKSSGLTVHADLSKIIIYEMITPKPDPVFGNTDYVHAYVTVTFKKADKSVNTLLHAVFAMQDGKIKTEWDIYDASGVAGLMK
ncbi:MAG: hypothetical protein WCJ80_07155 [Bacteroidota bacterium]|jgi:hypothetical protein